MKAPDKIVLPAAAGEMQFLIDDTVYIRKDAMLEWAKDMKAETEDVTKQHPEDESLLAEMHWWEVVIAKINAM